VVISGVTLGVGPGAAVEPVVGPAGGEVVAPWLDGTLLLSSIAMNNNGTMSTTNMTSPINQPFGLLNLFSFILVQNPPL
jgi:hypothetical protein